MKLLPIIFPLEGKRKRVESQKAWHAFLQIGYVFLVIY